MNLEALALVLMLVLWAALGSVCWLGAAVARRGRGGLLVPALGRRDGVGLLVSLLAAVVGGLVFTAAGLRLGR